MEIVLRNGEKIELDWNPIILEYLEEYDGGIEQLKKDIENKNCRFRTFNFITYCVISAIYPRELGYREAVSLVNIDDLDKIVVFIVQHVNQMKAFNVNAKEQSNKEQYPKSNTNNRKHRM